MAMEDNLNEQTDYGASQIQVLEGLEAVRTSGNVYWFNEW